MVVRAALSVRAVLPGRAATGLADVDRLAAGLAAARER